MRVCVSFKVIPGRAGRELDGRLRYIIELYTTDLCNIWPRCIKFAFERKPEKIKRKSLMHDSDWLKINLRLIFLICVQT